MASINSTMVGDAHSQGLEATPTSFALTKADATICFHINTSWSRETNAPLESLFPSLGGREEPQPQSASTRNLSPDYEVWKIIATMSRELQPVSGSNTLTETRTSSNMLLTPLTVQTTPAAEATNQTLAAQAKHANASTFAEAIKEETPRAPGSTPEPGIDVFVTLIFLFLFGLAAITHIIIARTNTKRGHKFLLSELLFDFCTLRVVTCIMRIVWANVATRGVVLASTIVQNGGVAAVFAVNLVLAQRVVRAMHPKFGWGLGFTIFSQFLIFSIPAVIAMNAVSVSVNFFSVEPVQREVTEELLMFGSSWNLMLAAMPLVWVFLASARPGPPIENFGSGDFRSKTSLLVFGAITMSVGASVRLAISVNGPNSTSPVSGKVVFYMTGFLLEIITVAAYAYFRLDLSFHIPNGAIGPGAYAKSPDGANRKESKAIEDTEEQPWSYPSSMGDNKF